MPVNVAALHLGRPGRVIDGNVEESRDPAHLAVEIGLEVVEVDEQHVGIAVMVPPGGNVVEEEPTVEPPGEVVVEVAGRRRRTRERELLLDRAHEESVDQLRLQVRHVVEERHARVGNKSASLTRAMARAWRTRAAAACN